MCFQNSKDALKTGYFLQLPRIPYVLLRGNLFLRFGEGGQTHLTQDSHGRIHQ